MLIFVQDLSWRLQHGDAVEDSVRCNMATVRASELENLPPHTFNLYEPNCAVSEESDEKLPASEAQRPHGPLAIGLASDTYSGIFVLPSVHQSKMGISKLFDFGFQHIDIWRSEPMSLAQVGGLLTGSRTSACMMPGASNKLI